MQVVRSVLDKIHDVGIVKQRRGAGHVGGLVRFGKQDREWAVGPLQMLAVPDENDAELDDGSHWVLSFEEHVVLRVAGFRCDRDERVKEEDALGSASFFVFGDRNQVEPGVESLWPGVDALVSWLPIS